MLYMANNILLVISRLRYSIVKHMSRGWFAWDFVMCGREYAIGDKMRQD